MAEDLIEVVGQWVATGQLPEAVKPRLKADYLAYLGATPGCTTCDSFWSDVRHHFWYAYKQLNRTTVAKSIRKYLILGSGFLMLPGQSMLFVNEGEDSADRTVLSDELAEHILTENPDYSQLIGINPAWQAQQDILANASAEAETTASADEATGDEDSEGTVPAGVHAQLQADYEALKEENKSLHKQISTLKGQLTKATKPHPAPAATTAPVSGAVDPTVPAVDTVLPLNDPAVAIGNPEGPANSNPAPETGDTSTAKTGATGTSDSGSSANSSSGAGNSGANATKNTVENAQ